MRNYPPRRARVRRARAEKWRKFTPRTTKRYDRNRNPITPTDAALTRFES